MIEKERKRG